METHQVIGFIAAPMSIMMATIGLGAQIRKTYITGETMSKVTAGVSVTLYSLWTLYGWTKPDPLLALAYTPGIVTSTIILVQTIVGSEAVYEKLKESRFSILTKLVGRPVSH